MKPTRCCNPVCRLLTAAALTTLPASLALAGLTNDVIRAESALEVGTNVLASGTASIAQGDDVVATGDYSIAAGEGAGAIHDNTFVWSDGSPIDSGTNRQFIVNAENGIWLLGGPISGDGSGLTNLAGSAIAFESIGSDQLDAASVTSDKLETDIQIYNSLSVGGDPFADASGVRSVAMGYYVEAAGYASFAQGAYGTYAEGDYSHAQGLAAKSYGSYGYAGGINAVSSGQAAHAEGNSTLASGPYSHAEGSFTIASGNSSHAEGYDTTASGTHSHAAGAAADAIHGNTYVWADGTSTSSSTNKQYTVYASNGIRLLGGPTEIAYILPQGDLQMGSYTNGLPQ